MTFIKNNWKQALTILLSCGVAVAVNLHVITLPEATAAGSILALVGIHLDPVTYGGKS